MKYADMFARVKGMFMQADVSDITEHLAYQFNITGEAEGIFYVEVKEGKLYVEPYEYFDRDAIFICQSETLFKLAEGKTDPILAFTTGKLKVEGNIDKALRLKELIDSKKAQVKNDVEDCGSGRPGRTCVGRGRGLYIFLPKNYDAL